MAPRLERVTPSCLLPHNTGQKKNALPAWMRDRPGNELIQGGGPGPMVPRGPTAAASSKAPPRRRFSCDDPAYERMKRDLKEGGAGPKGPPARRGPITPTGGSSSRRAPPPPGPTSSRQGGGGGPRAGAAGYVSDGGAGEDSEVS